jgi:O-antigen/teichoic acid export membrane protein
MSVRKVITSISLFSLGGLLPTIGRFIMTPVFTRFMEPSDYGITVSMAAMSNLLAIIFGLSLEKATFRFFHQMENDEEKQRLIGTLYWFSVLTCIPMILLCILLKPLMQSIYPSIPFFPFYLLTILNLIFFVMNKHVGAYYQITQQPKKSFLLNIAIFLSGIICSVLFIVVLKHKARGVLEAALVGNLLLLPFYTFIMVKRYKPVMDWELLKKSMRFIIPYFPVPIFIWVIGFSNRIIMENSHNITQFFMCHVYDHLSDTVVFDLFLRSYVNKGEVGLLGMAEQIPGFYYMMVQSIAVTFIPVFFKLAKDATPESRKIIERNAFIYNTSALVLALMAGLFVFEFTWMLLPKAYLATYQLARVGLFAQIFLGFMQITTNQYFQQAQKMFLQGMLYGVAAIISIMLNIILIPYLHAYGSTITALVTNLSLCLLQMLVIRKYFYVPVRFGIFSILVVVLAAVLLFFTFVVEQDRILALSIKLALLLGLAGYAWLKRDFLKGYLSNLRI